MFFLFFSRVDAETIVFFFLFDISRVAKAERFISSAQLAVIVGNQPPQIVLIHGDGPPCPLVASAVIAPL